MRRYHPLRIYREKLELTQVECSINSGISLATIGRVEGGYRPCTKTRAQIVSYLQQFFPEVTESTLWPPRDQPMHFFPAFAPHVYRLGRDHGPTDEDYYGLC